MTVPEVAAVPIRPPRPPRGLPPDVLPHPPIAAQPGAESHAAPPTRKPTPPFRHSELQFLPLLHNDWAGIAPAGSLPEDYLDPAMWVQETDLRVGDTVRVVEVSRAWMAEFWVVRGTGAPDSQPAVCLMRSLDLSEISSSQFATNATDDEIRPGYRVRPGNHGEGAPWVAERTADGFVVAQGFSRDEAVMHLKNLAIFRDDTKPPRRV